MSNKWNRAKKVYEKNVVTDGVVVEKKNGSGNVSETNRTFHKFVNSYATRI